METAAGDPAALTAFIETLGAKDPKTVVAYRTVLRAFVAWLAQQPGGQPFRMEIVTETAVRGYLDHLAVLGRAPQTRAKARTALHRFCRWAQAEGLLRRNPVAAVQRPTIATLAPTELTPEARFVIKSLVDRANAPRLAALVALGYWAGLRISEIAVLELEHCQVNQRAGSLHIVDGKGGKSRTLDLHNEARRALYAYLYEHPHADDARDRDSRYLFTGQRAAWLRRQNRPDHLSTRAIEHLWTGLKRSATRDEWPHIADVTFHDLRHDWAHRARAGGWLLEEIAVYLGHQTRDGAPAITTTARYTLPSRQQLKRRLHDLGG